MDFAARNPRLQPGESTPLVVRGNFADEAGVLLPASYFSFASSDPQIVSIDSRGLVQARGRGAAVLSVTSHGIQAVTAAAVGVPDDPTETLIYSVGLEIYPEAVSLLPQGGTRQLDVHLEDVVNVTAGSTGTRYYVSDSRVITVSEDGLITALEPGEATVTIVHGGSERVMHVRVAAAMSGPVEVGTDGGVVETAEGIVLQIAPGAFSAPTTVSASMVPQNELPIPVPSWLEYAAAIQLDVGSQQLQQPVQLALPAPLGVAPGEQVAVYRAGSYLDENGERQQIWLQVEVGKVGDDGMIRTTSQPYSGIDFTGTMLIATAVAFQIGFAGTAVIALASAAPLAGDFPRYD